MGSGAVFRLKWVISVDLLPPSPPRIPPEFPSKVTHIRLSEFSSDSFTDFGSSSYSSSFFFFFEFFLPGTEGPSSKFSGEGPSSKFSGI